MCVLCYAARCVLHCTALCLCSTLRSACYATLLYAAHCSALCVPCYIAPCVLRSSVLCVSCHTAHVCCAPLHCVLGCAAAHCACCSALLCACYAALPGGTLTPPRNRPPLRWSRGGRPGFGRSAHAGARGRTPGRQRAPAVAVLRKPGREGGHLAGSTPRLWPVCARRGEREDTRQASRPGCGCSAHARARGRTPGRQHAPAEAVLRPPGREEGHLAGSMPRLWPVYARRARGSTAGRQPAPAEAVPRPPGREGGHLAGSTPRLWPVCARRARRSTPGRQHAPAVAGMRTPGREGVHQAGSTPRMRPLCARRGGREDTRQAARPGCGRSANAGARGRTPGRQHAPAQAVLRSPGREGGHLAGSTPQMRPFCARQGEREDTLQAARHGSGRSTLAGAGGRTPCRQHAPDEAVLYSPGREGGHLAGSTPWLWPVCAPQQNPSTTPLQHQYNPNTTHRQVRCNPFQTPLGSLYNPGSNPFRSLENSCTTCFPPKRIPNHK